MTILGPNGQPIDPNAQGKILRLRPYTEWRVVVATDPQGNKVYNMVQVQFAPNGTVDKVSHPLMNGPSVEFLEHGLEVRKQELVEMHIAVRGRGYLEIQGDRFVEVPNPTPSEPVPDTDQILTCDQAIAFLKNEVRENGLTGGRDTVHAILHVSRMDDYKPGVDLEFDNLVVEAENLQATKLQEEEGR